LGREAVLPFIPGEVWWGIGAAAGRMRECGARGVKDFWGRQRV
jgi:hypothetical protein